jgi:hypothetical protein
MHYVKSSKAPRNKWLHETLWRVHVMERAQPKPLPSSYKGRAVQRGISVPSDSCACGENQGTLGDMDEHIPSMK